MLPPPLQGSLPAGWLAFTGRESNPQDRYKRFQIAVSSSFSGFILAQGKFHFVLHHCNSHNDLHCLPVLNGATCALRNFPECLTGRNTMLALADDAALARLVIAATRIPRRARSRWLHNLARTIEDRAADRMRQARARQRAVTQRGTAQGSYGT